LSIIVVVVILLSLSFLHILSTMTWIELRVYWC